MHSSLSTQVTDSGGRSASVRIVEAIAEREGTDPVALDPVLYEVVDPDALDSLFDGPDCAGTIEFTYLGYDVVVDGDGDITVSD